MSSSFVRDCSDASGSNKTVIIIVNNDSVNPSLDGSQLQNIIASHASDNSQVSVLQMSGSGDVASSSSMNSYYSDCNYAAGVPLGTLSSSIPIAGPGNYTELPLDVDALQKLEKVLDPDGFMNISSDQLGPLDQLLDAAIFNGLNADEFNHRRSQRQLEMTEKEEVAKILAENRRFLEEERNQMEKKNVESKTSSQAKNKKKEKPKIVKAQNVLKGLKVKKTNAKSNSEKLANVKKKKSPKPKVSANTKTAIIDESEINLKELKIKIKKLQMKDSAIKGGGKISVKSPKSIDSLKKNINGLTESDSSAKDKSALKAADACNNESGYSSASQIDAATAKNKNVNLLAKFVTDSKKDEFSLEAIFPKCSNSVGLAGKFKNKIVSSNLKLPPNPGTVEVLCPANINEIVVLDSALCHKDGFGKSKSLSNISVPQEEIESETIKKCGPEKSKKASENEGQTKIAPVQKSKPKRPKNVANGLKHIEEKERDSESQAGLKMAQKKLSPNDNSKCLEKQFVAEDDDKIIQKEQNAAMNNNAKTIYTQESVEESSLTGNNIINLNAESAKLNIKENENILEINETKCHNSDEQNSKKVQNESSFTSKWKKLLSAPPISYLYKHKECGSKKPLVKVIAPIAPPVQDDGPVVAKAKPKSEKGENLKKEEILHKMSLESKEIKTNTNNTLLKNVNPNKHSKSDEQYIQSSIKISNSASKKLVYNVQSGLNRLPNQDNVYYKNNPKNKALIDKTNMKIEPHLSTSNVSELSNPHSKFVDSHPQDFCLHSKLGNPHSEGGDPLVKLSNPHSKDGNPIVKTSNPHSKDGNLIVKTSNPHSKDGNLVVKTSNPHSKDGNPVVKTSNPHSKDGNPIVKTSNPHSKDCNPMLKTSNPHLKDGNPIVKPSNPIVKTSNPYLKGNNPFIKPSNPHSKDSISPVMSSNPHEGSTNLNKKFVNPNAKTNLVPRKFQGKGKMDSRPIHVSDSKMPKGKITHSKENRLYFKKNQEFGNLNDGIKKKTKNLIEPSFPEGRKSKRPIKKKSFGDEVISYSIGKDSDDADSDANTEEQDKELFDIDYDDPERLWCICKKPHNNRFMICCDICENWFHGSCVGVTRAMGKQYEEEGIDWKCPGCKKTAKVSKDSSSVQVKVPKDVKIVTVSETCTIDDHAKSVKGSTPQGINQEKKAKALSKKIYAEPRVLVYNTETGEILSGSNAPPLSKLKAFLKKNPTFSSVKPDMMKKGLPKISKPPTESSTADVNIGKSKSEINSLETTKEKACSEESLKELKKKGVLSLKGASSVHTSKFYKNEKLPKHNVKISRTKFTEPVIKPKKVKISIVKELLKASVPQKKIPVQIDETLSPSTPTPEKIPKTPDSENRTKVDVVRIGVRKSLAESLKKRYSAVEELTESVEEMISELATEIEEELFLTFDKNVSMKYKARYRSLIFNIRDPKNHGLHRKIVNGAITPKKLANMTSEELASKELAKWREREEKKELEAIQKYELDMISLGNQYIMKSHKGEIEINKDEYIKSKEKVPDLEMPLSVDVSGSLTQEEIHKSHIFDGNCSLCHDLSLSSSNKDDSLLTTDENISLELKSSYKFEKCSEHDEEDNEDRSTKTHKKKQHRHRSRSEDYYDSDERKFKDQKSENKHREEKLMKRKASKERHKHSKKRKKEHKRKYSESSDDSFRKKSRKHSYSEFEDDEEIDRSISKSMKEFQDIVKEENPKNVISDTNKSEDHQQQSPDSSNVAFSSTVFSKFIPPSSFLSPPKFYTDIASGSFQTKTARSPLPELPSPPPPPDSSTSRADSNKSLLPDFFLSEDILSSPATPPLPDELEETENLDKTTIEPEFTASSYEDMQSSEDQSCIWKGLIQMHDVAKFIAIAYEVSGKSDSFKDDVPSRMEVVGRITADQVWKYISEIKKNRTKEVLVVRFLAASDEDKSSYIEYYSYLSTRKRYGVVGNCEKTVKDFYIVPLASYQPIPQVLLPLDGPGFDDQRPNLLIGVIVRNKREKIFDPLKPDLWTDSKNSLPSVKPQTSEENLTPPYIIDDTKTKSPEESFTPPLEVPSVLDELLGIDESEDALNLAKRQISVIADKDERVPGQSNLNEMAPSPSPPITESGDQSLDKDTMLAELNRQIEVTKRELSEMEKTISTSGHPYDASDKLSNISLPSNLQEILDNIRKKTEELNIKENEVKKRLSIVSSIVSISSPEDKVSDISPITPQDEDLRFLIPRATEDQDLRIMPECISESDVDLRFRDPRMSSLPLLSVSPTRFSVDSFPTAMSEEERRAKAIAMETNFRLNPHRVNQLSSSDSIISSQTAHIPVQHMEDRISAGPPVVQFCPPFAERAQPTDSFYPSEEGTQFGNRRPYRGFYPQGPQNHSDHGWNYYGTERQREWESSPYRNSPRWPRGPRHFKRGRRNF